MDRFGDPAYLMQRQCLPVARHTLFPVDIRHDLAKSSWFRENSE
jgi:hypothetical protein